MSLPVTIPAISADELKTFVGKTTNEVDYWFEETAEAATSDFEDYIGQNVVEQSVTMEFDGDDSQLIKLPGSWITAITKIEQRSAIAMGATWTTVDATTYELQTRGQLSTLRSARLLSSSLMYHVTFVNGMILVKENIKRAIQYIGAGYYYNSNLPGGEHLLMFQNLSRSYNQGTATDSIKSLDDLKRLWQTTADKYRMQVC